MFKIIANSVRDNTDIPVLGEFIHPDGAKRHVERSFRGLSVYHQVFIVNGEGERVWHGYRAGPGGTGEHWIWKVVR